MKKSLQRCVRKSSVLFILACGFVNASIAQQSNWVDVLNAPNANYQSVKQAFYSDWNGISYKKGHGWKQFHRWEAFWETRVMPDGSFPDFKQAYNEHKGYMASHGLAKSGQNCGNWLPLGPFSYTNTQSWSPGMGRVNFIVEDPNAPATIYIGAPAGGIWKSTDTGANWTPLGDDLAVMGVSSIGISAANSNTIYLATGDADGGDTYSIGVLKSLDAGLTWNEVGNLSGNLKDIIADPTDEDIVYVASNTGLYKTIDGGANWNLSITGSFRDIEMKPGDSQVIYAATSEDIYYSTDAGTNWTLSTGVPAGNDRIAMAVTAGDDSYVYALIADNGGGYKGIYRSDDSGLSFSVRNTNTDVFDGSTQSWYDMAIGVSSTNPEIVFTGCLDVWRSTDGGTNISQLNSWSNPSGASYTHADIHFLKSYGGNIYCGSDGGIYRSTNNGTAFTDLTDGVQIGQFYTIAGSPNDVTTVAGGLQDNGGYVYNNNSWKVYYGADGMGSAVSPTNSDIVFGMIQYGDLYRTSNGGGNLQGLGSPQAGRWVTPLEHDPNATRVIAGYDDLYEYDGSWNQLSTFNFTEKLRSIDIYEANSSIMYVSTGDLIYKTIDDGATMTNVTNGLSTILSGNIITSIEIDPVDDNRLWVSIGGWTDGHKVAKSIDGGATWTNVSGTLPNLPCNVVKFESSATTGNAIYVGMDIGVYYSDDVLGDFIPFMVNLPNVIVNDLEINETSGVIRAGTFGRGVWESTAYSVVIVNDDAGVLNVQSPEGSFCGGQFTPELTLRNYGSDPLTQVDIEYQIDNGTISTFNWTGTLAPYTSTSVTLSSLSASGPHAFNVWTTNPNGVADVNTWNDTVSSNFDAVTNGVLLYTQIIEDCWGSEVYWGITDTNNVTILTGGPYSDGNEGNLNLDSVCLQSGCYDFILNDSYGDGLSGASYPSCGVDGDYYIITEFNDTLVAMPVADFGNQVVHNFCIPSQVLASFISNESEVCEGQTITFTDISAGATDWAWDFGAGASPATATGIGPHTVTYNSGGSPSVSLTINSGADVQTQTFVINALSVISQGTIIDPIVCGTTTGEIEITGSGNGNVTWSGVVAGSANSVILPYSITGLSAGFYTVTFEDTNGCISNVSQTLEDPTPPSSPVISAGGATTFCEGDSVLLTSSVSTGNSWSNSETSQTITVSEAGMYAVTITNGAGCSATSTPISISVNLNPALPIITASGTTTLCDGESVGLTSSYGSDNLWSTTAVTQTITISTDGTYTVTYTDVNSCEATSDPVTVTINALPIVSIASVDSLCNYSASIALSGTPSGGVFSGIGVSGGQFDPSVTGNGLHTVGYEYTDANGCMATTSIDIFVDGCAGIEEEEFINFVIYPNPMSDELNIQLAGEFSIDILDASGREILKAKGTNNLNVSTVNISAGVYFIHLHSELLNKIVRVVKE